MKIRYSIKACSFGGRRTYALRITREICSFSTVAWPLKSRRSAAKLGHATSTLSRPNPPATSAKKINPSPPIQMHIRVSCTSARSLQRSKQKLIQFCFRAFLMTHKNQNVITNSSSTKSAASETILIGFLVEFPLTRKTLRRFYSCWMGCITHVPCPVHRLPLRAILGSAASEFKDPRHNVARYSI